MRYGLLGFGLSNRYAAKFLKSKGDEIFVSESGKLSDEDKAFLNENKIEMRQSLIICISLLVDYYTIFFESVLLPQHYIILYPKLPFITLYRVVIGHNSPYLFMQTIAFWGFKV